MKSHAGLGAEPDGFIIDPVKKELYIVEAELSKHDPYKHINDLTRFINSMDNPHTKNAVVEGLWNKIKGNKSQKEYLEEKIDDENARILRLEQVRLEAAQEEAKVEQIKLDLATEITKVEQIKLDIAKGILEK